ncbi:hypothetical protein P154DRAFT_623250 [Amniculicola lignicola CBS 123094]|uniref:Uncharacterized protein n=1 Tax=Amniculicola lignicola CBS 123094 TaxID=1392246 RepID=A0A6A5WB08_9PLEO|nr:hypothetical protein P154DRAFT_623250 [Amniculicola lignicola CBS 123094]
MPSLSNAEATSKWSSTVKSQISEALKEYYDKETDSPRYASVMIALGAYIATRTDAPRDVFMAEEATTTYTTVPAWYSNLPTGVQEYASSFGSVETQIRASVLSKNGARLNTAPVSLTSTEMHPVSTSIQQYPVSHNASDVLKTTPSATWADQNTATTAGSKGEAARPTGMAKIVGAGMAAVGAAVLL